MRIERAKKRQRAQEPVCVDFGLDFRPHCLKLQQIMLPQNGPLSSTTACFESCFRELATCPQTFCIYDTQLGKLPIRVSWADISESGRSGDTTDFQIIELSVSRLDFTYSRASSLPGEFLGDSLPTPVKCSSASGPTASKDCPSKDAKRAVGPDGTIWSFVFYEWATCVW